MGECRHGHGLHVVRQHEVAAAERGRETQLTSLELGLGSTDFAGACDAGFSCAYTSTLCWRTPTTPLPMESNPRAVFERLFGDGDTTDAAVRRERRRNAEAEESGLDGLRRRRARATPEVRGP